MTNDNRVLHTHNKYTDAYVGILDTYKKQISNSVEKKNELKKKFFGTIKIIMHFLTIIFFISIVVSLMLFYTMIANNYSSAEIIAGAITTLISSFVTMILSIFKLPEIIAEYLFNKEEDKLMSEIIKNIQEYEIDAVKYEIENAKYERAMQLKVGLNIENESMDDDLQDYNYKVPLPCEDNQYLG